MIELKSEREAEECSTEQKRYLGMIWRADTNDRIGDSKTPWRVWHNGRSFPMYPEYLTLKDFWEKRQMVLWEKYYKKERNGQGKGKRSKG